MKFLLLTSLFSFLFTSLFAQNTSTKDKIIGKKIVGYTTSQKIDSVLKSLAIANKKNEIFLVDKNGDLIQIQFGNIPKKISFIQKVYAENPSDNFFIIYRREENEKPPK